MSHMHSLNTHMEDLRLDQDKSWLPSTSTFENNEQESGSSSYTTCHICAGDVCVAQMEHHSLICQGGCRPPSLSDYSILRQLGSGSYGDVWLAQLHSTGAQYAIKILDSQRPKFNIDRVQRERDILACCEHPNIIKLYYAFHEKDLFFLVLEYLQRGSVQQLVEQHRLKHGTDALPESLVRELMAQVVSALDYLHSRGIAHRDLKPENMLLDTDGHVVLADFGLASGSTPPTGGGAALFGPVPSAYADLRASSVGSPLYRSPETFSEVVKRHPLPQYATRKTDAWSLGVCLHELLTGSYALNKLQVPHDIEDSRELHREMRAYVSGDRTLYWPESVQVSERAKALVSSLLDPSPARRPSLSDVKNDPFFAGVDWNSLANGKVSFLPSSPAAKSPKQFKERSFFTGVWEPRARDFTHVAHQRLRAANMQVVGEWRRQRHVADVHVQNEAA